MKSLLQIIAAVLYSAVFVCLLAIIYIIPMGWFFSLPIFWMILFFIFLFGIFQALIKSAQALITAPYAWIVKNNAVSLIISLVVIIVGMIAVAIKMWQTGPHGVFQVAATVIMTILLLEAVLGTAGRLAALYTDN